MRKNERNYTGNQIWKFTACLISAGIMWLSVPFAASAANGLNVNTPSQDQIRTFVSENGDLFGPVVYEREPDVTSGKTAYIMGDQGELAEETRQRALKMLKNIRYIAGLSTDITLDETLNSRAQAGAYVDYVYGDLTHNPKQPSGMDDDLYQLGLAGTQSSNIAYGHKDLTQQQCWTGCRMKMMAI